ncbi:MAG: DUF1045 domain-containing protein [Deltaproteobacteria bacterium]|jgi:hypothetical protein|nr:DUF1045 domain-containing protein [Deltaproteobacteria bacterium]
MTPRYCVYHAPPADGVLYRTGSKILGRCLRTGLPLSPPWPPGPAEWLAPPHPAKAAVYGFHATLVAPFKTSATREVLELDLARLAARLRAVRLGALELRILGQGFPALVPKTVNPALLDLERELVAAMSPRRLPPEPGDIARREPLTSRQRMLARRWGYPYVLEEFQYHLTLGDNMTDRERPAAGVSVPGPGFQDILAGCFPPGSLDDLVVDELCLCRQGGPGENFEIAAAFKLLPPAASPPKTDSPADDEPRGGKGGGPDGLAGSGNDGAKARRETDEDDLRDRAGRRGDKNFRGRRDRCLGCRHWPDAATPQVSDFGDFGRDFDRATTEALLGLLPGDRGRPPEACK